MRRKRKKETATLNYCHVGYRPSKGYDPLSVAAFNLWQKLEKLDMAKIPKSYLTDRQRSYLQILSDDLGFKREQRNAHIKELIGHSVKGLDELTKIEAIICINKFKEWKESAKSNNPNPNED